MEEQFQLQIQLEDLKAQIKAQKDKLDFYEAERDDYKKKTDKEETKVAKKLRELDAAMKDGKAKEAALIADIKAKDEETANLKKKVEELQREKLNAIFVSLQEEITEYREILDGWKERIVNNGSPMKKAYENMSVVHEPEAMQEDE